MRTPPSTESITFKSTDRNARRLLISFAHPDDESFGPSGTQIRYAKAGIGVHYICGTRGEAGSVDDEFMKNYETIGELRTAEMMCAAKVLGLSSLHFLNYHDSGMENTADNENPACLIQADVEEVAEKVTHIIRQIRPQVVLTFDPTGGYFHPDHIHMHKATTVAFHAAGDPTKYPHQLTGNVTPYHPQKLYYTAFPRGLVRFFVRILPLFGKNPSAFGKNKDIDLKRIADVKERVTTRIAVGNYFEQSEQAAACHASQLGGGPNRIPRFLQRWLARYDTYTRIFPPIHDNQKETDFFADVDIK